MFHYRNSTGSFKNDKGHFYRFGALGSPDIVCVVDGRYVGIEVKDTKGKLSESQIEFRRRLEEAGGTYIVARSIDDLITRFPS